MNTILHSIAFNRERFPYYEIEADPQRNTVVFKAGEDKHSIEELVAQILQKARDFAEDAAGQSINECVIVVPGYFGQAERVALLTAGNIANIKILELINDHMAVALNYAIFQQKDFNETAQYFAFYDMGSYKTSATVVSYQLVKDKVTRETNPVIQVLGVGYDRTLGGLEMQLRLRDYLAKEFNNLKKTPTDVFSSPRALAKLLKEAGRLKTVLSANQEHFAQIEGLLDEKDFKLPVTRETFEGLCGDLFERVPAPLERALAASGLTLDVMNQVVLFGGGVRVPKVQEVLKAYTKTDLAKNINMDEAAAMGAVYKAADLATGFKVRKFVTRDAVVLPIQVTFEREGSSGSTKLVKRNLFTAMNSYPQKKVITFNKNMEDFKFNVTYAELDHLPEHEVKNIGNLTLFEIALNDVAKIYEANSGENIESKGIKSHFILDDSGIFQISSIELVIEKTITEAEEESSFAKLGNTITKLFSGNEEEKKDDAAKEDKKDETKETEGEKEQSKEDESAKEGKTGNETATNTTTTFEEPAAVNKTEADNKPKVVTEKIPIPNKLNVVYTVPLVGEQFEASRKKVEALYEAERQALRRDTALNALESYVIDVQQKLDEEEYSSCATPDEIENIRKACSEVSDWLYEDGSDADAETYEKKLIELKEKTNDMFARHWEHRERPEALKALGKMLEDANGFLKSAKNLTAEANPDRDIFTPVEIDVLEKAIKETEEWHTTEKAAQNKLKNHEPVRLTVNELTNKMKLLDREVKYLVNKMKLWKPKTPKKEKKAKVDNQTAEEKSEGEKIETEKTEGEKADTEGEKSTTPTLDGPTIDVPPANDEEQPTATTTEKEKIAPTEPSDKDKDGKAHSEL